MVIFKAWVLLGERMLSSKEESKLSKYTSTLSRSAVACATPGDQVSQDAAP